MLSPDPSERREEEALREPGRTGCSVRCVLTAEVLMSHPMMTTILKIENFGVQKAQHNFFGMNKFLVGVEGSQADAPSPRIGWRGHRVVYCRYDPLTQRRNARRIQCDLGSGGSVGSLGRCYQGTCASHHDRVDGQVG